jgi:hypothetical protein
MNIVYRSVCIALDPVVTCPIKFGSWTYHKGLIDTQVSSIALLEGFLVHGWALDLP